MTDKRNDGDKDRPELGSPADLLPEPEPDNGKDIGEEGEPPGGGNFA